MFRNIISSTFIVCLLLFPSCNSDDTGDPQSKTLYRIDNQSDIDLRYKKSETTDASYFLDIPANSSVEIEEYVTIGTGITAPDIYFESLKLRNEDNTIVYEQLPINNDFWSLDSKTFTLTITNNAIN